MTPNSASFLDYVGYFFQGYKTDAMNQVVLAILRGLQYVIVAFLGGLIASVLYDVAHGKDLWDLATWQTGATAGVILVLGILNEAVRKFLNPSVSIKTLPANSQPTIPNASVVTPLEQQLGKAIPSSPVEHPGPHETVPKVRPSDIPPDH